MAYATTRNKALRNEWRLITAHDDAGNAWYIPDGHFMVQFPIYDGYKMKKSQIEMGPPARDINVQVIIDGVQKAHYTRATVENNTAIDKDDVECAVISNENGYEWVDRAYLDLFLELYPDCELYIDDETPVRPVQVINAGEMVGIIGVRVDRSTLNQITAIAKQEQEG